MRIAGSLVFILLLFILTAVLVKVPMEADRFFSVTMATIWFINCKSVWVKAWNSCREWRTVEKCRVTQHLFSPAFGAVLQGSLFGLVGLLPQKYSTVFMSGQGLAGTFAAIAMLLAIASEPPTQNATLCFFPSCLETHVELVQLQLQPPTQRHSEDSVGVGSTAGG